MSLKHLVIPLVAVISIAILLTIKPIPQDPAYHLFADQRSFGSIPNFLNVITNLPFLFIGIGGLLTIRHHKRGWSKWLKTLLFAGFILLFFGSGYYHLQPGNVTLVYDRLPITLVIISFFSIIILDYISKTASVIWFVMLFIFGIFSVLYWIVTEQAGKGDLRWYGFSQFFPVVAIPIVLVLYTPRLHYLKYIVIIFLCFGLAKLSEAWDASIYRYLSHTISGHSLKHLFMSIAGYEIIQLTRSREVQEDAGRTGPEEHSIV